jgi:hypothetical protein
MEKQYLSNKELYIEVIVAKHKVTKKRWKNARTFSKEDNQKMRYWVTI